MYTDVCLHLFVRALRVSVHACTHKTQKHKQNSVECPGGSWAENGCKSQPSTIASHHEYFRLWMMYTV
jgi:hypothetical protein